MSDESNVETLRRGPGDNLPPDRLPALISGAENLAVEVKGYIGEKYAQFEQDVAALLTEARALPKEVPDEATASQFTAVVKRMRELRAKLEALRTGEKEPYFRGGQAVDQFFNPLKEKLGKEKKTDKDGASDVLEARVHNYNMKRLAEEQAARAKREREEREAEEAARRVREQAEREQREAEERAARARKQENVEAAEKIAREAEERAAAARAEEEAARDRRREAEANSAAKPADMVRERHGDGAINTMRMVAFVEITDSMKLDAVALWPFVKDDAKKAALVAWAKTTNHKKQMAGAIIEMRPDTVIR